MENIHEYSSISGDGSSGVVSTKTSDRQSIHRQQLLHISSKPKPPKVYGIQAEIKMLTIPPPDGWIPITLYC